MGSKKDFIQINKHACRAKAVNKRLAEILNEGKVGLHDSAINLRNFAPAHKKTRDISKLVTGNSLNNTSVDERGQILNSSVDYQNPYFTADPEPITQVTLVFGNEKIFARKLRDLSNNDDITTNLGNSFSSIGPKASSFDVPPFKKILTKPGASFRRHDALVTEVLENPLAGSKSSAACVEDVPEIG